MSVTLAEVAASLPAPASLVGPGSGADPSEVVVVDATHDSRQVAAGWLFCAVPGARTDGHDHLAAAAAAGAAAALVERPVDVALPQLQVPSVRAAMGPAAAAVHGHPSRQLTIVGTTGTNGKTTVSGLVEGAFAAAGIGTGVIGTLGARIHGESVPGVRTTPEGPDLQRLLRRMHGRGVDAVAAEVSSHGLELHRIDGTRIAVAVYTNLSQDHLDFHGTMERYLAAKARLFTPALSERGVVFLDGPWGWQLLEQVAIPVTTLGWADADGPPQDVRITAPEVDLSGGRAHLVGEAVGEVEVRTRLPGRFNLANAATALLAAVLAGVEARPAAEGIAAAPGPRGRLERVEVGAGPQVLVDYAHTPEAVTTVLATVRESLPAGGRLLLVLGCGGDRDHSKRGPMGAAATAADVAVLTSDNPRSEDPEAILAAMVTGARAAVEAGATASVVVELDRRRAIGLALAEAGADDVVLIAGKGHETVQELADRVAPFDDREVAAAFLTGAEERP
ncbi:MAG: UDP-N-acetylmuramoyl-L-alanyl-D-glutamate--2,6-diaminopimelate ligase [Nitriliruptoraceae bacterium]